MSETLRKRKEHENKLHELLYNHLALLTNLHPPRKEFKAMFKKDMFVKNNKQAANEVIYYLLHTLNPQVTKEKLTNWPPFDAKGENKLRSQIVIYINELNNLYDSANIATVMPSQLISPGGFKFVRFLLKLSSLVVFEELRKRNNKHVLYPITANKNSDITEITISNVKKTTALVEKETKESLEEYEEFVAECRSTAAQIVSDQARASAELGEQKTIYESLKKDIIITSGCLESLQEKIAVLQIKSNSFQEICNLLNDTAQLVSHLTNEELTLKHSKSDLAVPNEIMHLINANSSELDLIKFFQSVHSLLEQKSLYLPNPTRKFLSDSLTEVNDLTEKLTSEYDRLNGEPDEVINGLSDLSKKLEQLQQNC